MKNFTNLIENISSKHKYHFLFFVLLLIALTYVMMQSYTPIYLASDPFFHHNRLLILMDALKSGDLIYIDYNSINGYGYFSKAFYSDLTLVPYAIIGNIVNIQFAYFIYILSMPILSGIVTYYVMRKVNLSSFCSITSSLLYTFSTYKIYQTFYFSNVPEIMTFVFMPIVGWGLYEIIAGNAKKWYILAIGYSLIIYTHLLTSMLLLIIMLLFVIVYHKQFIHDKSRIKYLIMAASACFVLTAYYILPMMEQMFSNSFYFETKPHAHVKNSGVPLSKILIGTTNNFTNIDHSNYFPKIGGLLVCLICLRIFIQDRSKTIKFVDLGVLVGVICIFTNTLLFPWEYFPFNKLGFIQFSWRLLKYTTLFFALAGGYYLSLLIGSNTRKVITLVFLTLLIIFTMKYDSYDYLEMSKHNYSNSQIDEKIVKEKAYIGGGAEYLPSKVPSIDFFEKRGSQIIVDNGEATTEITNYKKEAGTINFNLETNKFTKLEFPLTYYKGYACQIGNEKIKTQQSENGLLEIRTNKSGQVKIWYDGTLIQKISPFISFIGFIFIISYIVYIRKKEDF